MNVTPGISPAGTKYGIGWAYGNVTYAAVEFAGYVRPFTYCPPFPTSTHVYFRINISSQALLDVKSATNPALS